MSSQTISGFVTDETNGERLIAVNVYLENTQMGTTTNKGGYYILRSVPPGKYRIIYSYMGYSKHEKDVTVAYAESVILNIALKPTVIEGASVKVVSDRVREEETVQTHLKPCSSNG